MSKNTKNQTLTKAAILAAQPPTVTGVLMGREFSTGSCGAQVSGKALGLAGGLPVTYQVNILVTAIGSKANADRGRGGWTAQEKADYVAGFKPTDVAEILKLCPPQARVFSTGSVGFQGHGKVALMVGSKPVLHQVNVLLTALKSNTLPAGDAQASA